MVKIGRFEVRSEYQYWDNFTWLNRISDNELYIGISDYAQQMLKDITSINPPAEGQRFVSGSDLLTIESISREYILKSPVSCVIQEVNSFVINSPEILNSRPFDHWIVRLEVLDHGDLDQLIDGEDMADTIQDEVGLEQRAFDDDSLGNDDFDYESEFSIDSGESYEFYDDGRNDLEDENEEFDDEW
ncbi:MAG: glycine cleavage system protein H [Candidatus Kariarchaeaceae archaeon]